MSKKNVKVVVLRTSSSTVLEDYRNLLHEAAYQNVISKKEDTLIKINLSWTKYFPACSTQPWQLEGLLKTVLDDGYSKEKLFSVENKTVVMNPVKGANNNRWPPVLDKCGKREPVCA